VKLGWMLVPAIAATAVAAPNTATLATALPPPATLDDPCVDGNGATCAHHALDGFRAAFDAQRDGDASHPLRVSYFGDSVTADDHLTHALRGKLQALLGDGGPGFVFAAPPHPYCQHRAVARVVSDGWTVHGISTVVPPDRLLGLGGTVESDAGGTIRLVPTGAFRDVDIDYLAQPHGGTLELAADGKVISTIATAADRKQGAFASTTVPDGTRRLELRARGHVRLFGVTLEAARGAVVDNLGVVNATAKAMHEHDLEDHLKNQLAHRASDLVVLMYGTNEAEWLRANGAGMAEHEKLFGELLATVRAANPTASCLVVSPLDQLDWREDTMPPRDSIPAMVAAQHRAATVAGCAFWDAFAWMGGKGASREWNKHGLMIKDFQHPTSEGAERIAAALYAGLVGEH
jgi:lysophospholipase L1-like esterase